MKRLLFFLSIGLLTVSIDGTAGSLVENKLAETFQSGQEPSMKKNRRDQTKPSMGTDSSAPGQRKRPRLRPDSLRRGGTTKVDTI